MKIACFVCALLCLLAQARSQPIDVNDIWPAQWIRAAEGPQKDFGVFHFRKTVELDSLPRELLVHSSGDNRYQLYVNGQLATWGPQRGDLEHWYYETTNLMPFLQQGENTLAAVVWNYGAQGPDAQFSIQTAFVFCADDRRYRSWNTGNGWKAIHNPAVQARPVARDQLRGYYGAGAKEQVDGRQYPWGWQRPEYDHRHWPDAVPIESPKAKACIWAGRWKLLPRTLPLEERRLQRLQATRQAEGLDVPKAFPAQAHDLHIPAHQRVRLVLDQGMVTTAYPELEVSQGTNAQLTVKYAEAPLIGALRDRNKGNRNRVEGKTFYGYSDRFIADGGAHRVFAPLWWRAYRYWELIIETEDEPLMLHDVRGLFTAYPFEQRAQFMAEGEALPFESATFAQLLEVGTRTTRLCAHETFMDCPYFEECQFIGDTRIEALVSYTNFGDARLGKQAIEQFAWSINSEGFLSARYPANSTYYIPNFSIAWIGMLHDYLMYVGEPDFIRAKLPIVRNILAYFLRRQREDGSIRYPDYHNFVDWAFPKGEAPVNEDGYAALVDLHVLMALQWAAELENAVGEASQARACREQAERLRSLIHETYWQPSAALFSDTPTGTRFSQHTNSLAVLTGVIAGDTAQAVMKKVLQIPEGMTPATLYWSFYVFEAVHAAGLGGSYPHHMGIWLEALAAGVTTWPETGLRSRSECHGWGASPNFHLPKLMGGIRPASPGFETVEIAPKFGDADKLTLEMPHPKGTLRLELTRDQQRLQGRIELPEGVTGVLHWQGKQQRLDEPIWEGSL